MPPISNFAKRQRGQWINCWCCFPLRFHLRRIRSWTQCVKLLCSLFGQTGLYRLSGSDRTIKELKEKFLRGKTVPMLSKVDDIHAITGLLKDFLRSLKEPLLTFRLNQPFMDAAGTHMTTSNTGTYCVFYKYCMLETLTGDLLAPLLTICCWKDLRHFLWRSPIIHIFRSLFHILDLLDQPGRLVFLRTLWSSRKQHIHVCL